MDKRSLLFVIGLTIIIFLIHQAFDYKDAEKRESYLKQQQMVEARKQQKLEEEIANRTAPLASLPVKPLYLDPQSTQIATLALDIDKQYLTLRWAEDIPSVLYTSQKDQGRQLQLVIGQGAEIGQPVLYSSTSEPSLSVAFLPDVGSSDLQLVTFSENNTEAYVILGQWENGITTIPLKKLNQNAIALYKMQGAYLPFGIYEPKELYVRPLEDYPYFSSVAVTKFPYALTKRAETEEQFYVLENEYQQLVFSNWGGALAEINLPLKGKGDEKSIVAQIGFDRIMQKDHPNNDHFPSSKYRIVKEGEVKEIFKGQLGGYYPLLRRDIIGPSGHPSFRVPPHYHALTVITEGPELPQAFYQITRFEKNLIEFTLEQDNRRIVKTFTLPSNASETPYCFEMAVKVDGDARGLWLTSGVPEVELISGNPAPSLKYLMQRGQKRQLEQIDLPKTTSTFSNIHPNWLCNSNGFFGLILDPLTEWGAGFSTLNIPGQIVPTRLTLIDARYQLYPAEKYPGYGFHIPLKANSQIAKMRIFAGPLADHLLKQLDSVYSADYIKALSFQGWFTFISEPFAKFLFFLMKVFYQMTHSWGFAIILLTVALRIMLYPLNAWSLKSTTKMQQIAPQVTAIQAKYKKDPKKAQMEVMNLYREKGVNPFTGCFPLLIQLPFLIGMFDLLKTTFELRGASFIPGWIDNLTAPDVLFSWNYPILFFGTQFHLLPIILGVVMYLQQKFSSALPKDKSLLTDQQKQQKMMGNIMTLVFAVLFYHFPSGLNLYWLFSMLLGIVQQWITQRSMAQQACKPGKIS